MSGCTLQFTRNSPLRTTLVDDVSGQVKYKIDTPIKIAGRVTQIRKFESDTQALHNWDELEESDSDSDDNITDKKGEKQRSNSEKEEGSEIMELAELQELPGMSDEMARIYWHWFSSDRIEFRGLITTRNEFLPRCGKMKGSFTFTGPDGVQYRWALGATGLGYPKLVTTDEEKKVIAEFHRAHHIRKKEKAKLEVQPVGMHMLDHIVLTLVIAEQTRREREVAVATH